MGAHYGAWVILPWTMPCTPNILVWWGLGSFLASSSALCLCARVSSSGGQRREKRSERTPENSVSRFISVYVHGLPNLLKYIANTCSANYAYAHLLSSYLHIPPCLSISLHCGQVFTSPQTYRAIVTQLASQLHYLLNGLEHVHVIISRSFIILLMIK